VTPGTIRNQPAEDLYSAAGNVCGDAPRVQSCPTTLHPQPPRAHGGGPRNMQPLPPRSGTVAVPQPIKPRCELEEVE
jgi:hypothetical protein